MTNMARARGRPTTKLKKLQDIKNTITNQEVKNKIDRLVKHLEDREYNDIKRGIEFLKSVESKYENTNDYNKQKIFKLSDKLGRGEIKQLRTTTRLTNILLDDDVKSKARFKTQVRQIKERVNKPKSKTVETAFTNRIKDTVLKFSKKARGLNVLNHVLKHAKEIQTQLREHNALKLKLNVNFIFRFENNTQHTLDIYTTNTALLTSDLNEINKQLNHHIN